MAVDRRIVQIKLLGGYGSLHMDSIIDFQKVQKGLLNDSLIYTRLRIPANAYFLGQHPLRSLDGCIAFRSLWCSSKSSTGGCQSATYPGTYLDIVKALFPHPVCHAKTIKYLQGPRLQAIRTSFHASCIILIYYTRHDPELACPRSGHHTGRSSPNNHQVRIRHRIPRHLLPSPSSLLTPAFRTMAVMIYSTPASISMAEEISTVETILIRNHHSNCPKSSTRKKTLTPLGTVDIEEWI